MTYKKCGNSYALLQNFCKNKCRGKFKTCTVHQIALKLLLGRKKRQDIFETEACCPRKMQKKGPFVQHLREFGCKKTLIKFKRANSVSCTP